MKEKKTDKLDFIKMNSCTLKDTGLLLSYCQILSAFYIWIQVYYQICILQAFSPSPCFVYSVSSQCHNEIGNFFPLLFSFSLLNSPIQKSVWNILEINIVAVTFQSLKSCLTLYSPWTATLRASLHTLSPGVCSNSCPLSQ